MHQHLVVTALGNYTDGLIETISGAINDFNCSIGDSRISIHGDQCTLLVRLSGNWDAVARLEDALPQLAEQFSLDMRLQRIQPEAGQHNSVPYAIDAVCADRPGVVNDIARFMTENGVRIHDLYSNTYQAANTGIVMFSVHMTISFPVDTSISSLRNDFMDFCDRLNLDAIMEPVK